jgi:hypothetical protein
MRVRLGYAVEPGHLSSNPVDRIQWTTPAVAQTVDRRVVVSPAQARKLLVAVRGLSGRGAHLEAFYACGAVVGPAPRQATYDPRRLRRKQLIERIPGAHRYQLTQTGRAVAVLFTKAYGRLLGPGLAALDPRLPPDVTPNSPFGSQSLARMYALAAGLRTCDSTPQVSAITASRWPDAAAPAGTRA